MFGHDSPAVQRETHSDHIAAGGVPPYNPQSPTPSTVADAIRLFTGADPHRLVEVRALNVEECDWRGPRVERVHSGLYWGDEIDLMAAEVARVDGRCTGVYVLLNPVTHDRGRASLTRAYRTFGISPRLRHAWHAIRDCDIIHRDRLLLDLDPIRPEGYGGEMATEAEREAAFAKWSEVWAFLSARGLPRPTLTSTGSGLQPVWRCEPMAWDDDLIPRLLAAIDQRYSDAAVKLDATVGNAARIARLPFTWNRKGSGEGDRPHRRAELLQVGDDRPVTREQMEALVAELPAPPAVRSRTSRTAGSGRVSVSVGSTALRPDIDARTDRRIRGFLARRGGAIEGRGGRTWTFATAGVLLHVHGCSEEQAFDYMVSRTDWNSRCVPPWPDDELRERIASAAKDSYLTSDERPTLTAVPTDVEQRLLDSILSRPVPTDDDFAVPSAPGKYPYCSDCDSYDCPKPKQYGHCGCRWTPDAALARLSDAPAQPAQSASTNTSTVHTGVDVLVPPSLLTRLIGQPSGEYCRRAPRVGLEGYSATAVYAAVALVRCRCWSCAECRDYDRYLQRREHLPIVAAHATHLYRGTAAEWDGLRARLSRAGVRCATYAVSDGVTRTVAVAVAPDSPPVPDRLADVIRPVSRLDAVTAIAAAIDGLPAHLPPRTRKWSPSQAWADLIRPTEQAEPDTALADQPTMTAEERRAAATAARDQAIIDRGGIVWRRVDAVPLHTPTEVARILREQGITDYSRGALAGDNVLDSIVWEVPVEPDAIEALRRAIYEPSVILPDSRPDDWGTVIRTLLAV